MNDPFGAAIQDFFLNNNPQKLIVNSNYTENEEIDPAYFFRTYDKMPAIEQKAINLCRGNILDIGAAAGCHSIVLQNKQFKVTALDQSLLSCKVMEKRGLKHIIHQDIYQYNLMKYDTILLLMNGAGIGGTVDGLKKLLTHLKLLLNKNGQILVDSSDIQYLFYEEDGSYWIDINNEKYYGEMQYCVEYKSHLTSFDWLFIDFKRLKEVAELCNFSVEKIYDGEHHDYLVRLY